MPPAFRRSIPLSLVVVLPCLACSPSPTTISIDITTGQETDAFSQTPAVTEVDINITSVDGSVNETIKSAPSSKFDFGTFDNTEQISIDVTGKGADGTTLVRGQSLSGLLLSSLEGTLPVFVERLGGWSRPPNGLAATHVGGTAAVFSERYLMLAGGAAATADTASNPANLDGYDELGLVGNASVSSPVNPLTMLTLGRRSSLSTQPARRGLISAPTTVTPRTSRRVSTPSGMWPEGAPSWIPTTTCLSWGPRGVGIEGTPRSRWPATAPSRRTPWPPPAAGPPPPG